MRTTSFVLGVLLALGASGCYKTVFHTSVPPAAPSAHYDETWHHSFIWGFVELRAVNLDAACPGGSPAEIHERVSFLNFLVSGVLRTVLGVVVIDYWSPRTVTIHCGPAAGPPPAPAAAPLK